MGCGKRCSWLGKKDVGEADALRSEQAQCLRFGHSLRAFVDAKLAVEIFGVITYGVEADDQCVGDSRYGDVLRPGETARHFTG